jgi:hypothetical protein
MSKNQIAALILVGILFLVGIPATLYLVKQQQEPQSQAQQACTPPAAPTNMDIDYPDCGDGTVGSQCDPSKALCRWDPVADAVSYNIVVTEVESSNVVLTQSVTDTRLSFSVTPGNTYKCEVSAINSCQATGPTGSHQEVCAIDGLVTATPTATPTVPPTTPTPTFTPTPTLITVLPTDTPAPTDIFTTPTPIPTVPVVGSADTMVMMGIGAVALMILGSLVLLL